MSIKYRVHVKSGPWWSRRHTVAEVDNIVEVNEVINKHSQRDKASRGYRAVIQQIKSRADEMLD